MLTLSIRDVLPATPRARILRVDLDEQAFEYLAGQAVLIATHGYEKRRPYSISSAPEDAKQSRAIELLIGVDANGFAGPHLTLEPGTRVDVEGPLGTFTFPPDPVEPRFIFIAGGTGIAPLRAMLRHALAIPHRAIGLFYSARTPDEFAYKTELQRLARRNLIALTLTMTGGLREDADDAWRGERGRISASRLAQALPAPDPLCFICGPPALVDDVPPLLLQLGVKSARIRTEEW